MGEFKAKVTFDLSEKTRLLKQIEDKTRELHSLIHELEYCECIKIEEVPADRAAETEQKKEN